MKTITPNDLQPMDAPADGWYHIESNDDHPAIYDGTRIVQVLDNDAMASIAAAGVPEEYLFDPRMVTETNKRTSAA